MRIEVTIHRILKKFLEWPGDEDTMSLDLQEGATPRTVLDDFGLRSEAGRIFLFVNRRKVLPSQPLAEGDHLMIYPRLAGG